MELKKKKAASIAAKKERLRAKDEEDEAAAIATNEAAAKAVREKYQKGYEELDDKDAKWTEDYKYQVYYSYVLKVVAILYG